MRPSSSLENQIPSSKYWKVQLVSLKIQAHTFSEPPQEYNFRQIKIGDDLLDQLGIYMNIMQIWITSRRKTRLRDTSVIKIWVLRNVSYPKLTPNSVVIGA